MMKRFWQGVVFLAALASQTVLADPTGIYVGSMHLVDGFARDIPLQLALTVVGETQIVNNVVEQIIEGQFLVDDEGGPFSFSQVQLKVETSQIHLTYFRPQVSNVGVTPSFQLKGKFTTADALEGEVFSGKAGIIGTFAVAKSKNRMLTIKRKYQGTWTGTLTNLPDQTSTPFSLSLADSELPAQNPVDFEFEYSRGKATFYSTDDYRQTVQFAYFDYLRRKVLLVDKGAGSLAALSIHLDLSADGNVGTGDFNSVYRGHRGSFQVVRGNP